MTSRQCCTWGARQTKNTGLFGSFSHVLDPPRPPYLGGLRPKNPKNPKIQKIQKIVKHVLAPQNDFGMPKNYLVKSQKFWDFGRPPPPV